MSIGYGDRNFSINISNIKAGQNLDNFNNVGQANYHQKVSRTLDILLYPDQFLVNQFLTIPYKFLLGCAAS
ncbi:hypothetical protein [Dapis sp. BLCC M229]|uniref:hypothetical protein n=1 Tax=Dapis sp. BLCC M229 TaxID=3400188 RepID=UPI003CF7C1A6